MESHGDVIPPDFESDAIATLGDLAKPVMALIRRLNNVHWLKQAGKPEPWDNEVVRVWTLEDAKRADRESAQIEKAVWNALEQLGREVGRFPQMRAAEDLWIVRYHPRFDSGELSYSQDVLFPQIRTDIVGALREAVLSDIVPVRFFRESLRWYEKGHWRCAILPDGRRVVY